MGRGKLPVCVVSMRSVLRFTLLLPGKGVVCATGVERRLYHDGCSYFSRAAGDSGEARNLTLSPVSRASPPYLGGTASEFRWRCLSGAITDSTAKEIGFSE